MLLLILEWNGGGGSGVKKGEQCFFTPKTYMVIIVSRYL